MAGRRIALAAGVVLALAGGAPAAAREIAGVALPDTVEVAGETLRLNGAGLRTRFFVRVYVIGLYLARPARTFEAVLADPGPKRVVLHMVRALDAEQIAGAVEEGFARNSADRMPALRARLDRLLALFPAVEPGDRIELTVAGGRTTVGLNGAERGSVEGADFGDALLAVWLGPSPADTSLRTALLGG